MEILLAFFLCLTGQIMQVGPFLEIKANSLNRKELMSPPYRTRDFDSYNTRLGLFEKARTLRKLKEEEKNR